MEKSVVMNNMQLTTIAVDVIGIILVLIGALIVHAHSNSRLGLGLYWLGFVLLIVALIIFVLTMRKVGVKRSNLAVLLLPCAPQTNSLLTTATVRRSTNNPIS